MTPDEELLPYTKEEIKSIPERLFPEVKNLRNSRATTDAFVHQANLFDVLHIAAHGEIDDEFPFHSRIRFNDRTFALSEVLRLRISPKLVFLSSCETGLSVGDIGELRRGNRPISFSGAFLFAGARSVISPFWSVEDRSTAELVSAFYRALSAPVDSFQSVTLTQALASAQRDFIRNGDSPSHKSHPFYWAGFYLLGDGR